MHKNKERVKKLHIGSRKRMLVAGTLAIFFATVLMMSMLQMDSMNSEAKGGAISGSNSDGDAFWKGISVPRDLVITQTVTVKDANLSETKTFSHYDAAASYGCEVTNGNAHTTSVSRSFAVEGKFQPTITTTVNNNYNKTGSSNTWYDYAGAERYFYTLDCRNKGAYTYYYVYTDQSYSTSTTMGMKLFKYYLDNYQGSNETSSADMMITTKEDWGRILVPVLEACAENYGWKSIQEAQLVCMRTVCL